MNGGNIDPTWGFLDRLLQCPTVGAVITPWALALTGPFLIEELADSLHRGERAGDALGKFLRSRDAVRHGIR